MPVIAVINRKGGSGKSTLATHLAAYCAHHGLPALLGDADFQQSSHAWLRQRDRQRLTVAPRIVGWTVDPKNVLRAPPGVTHVVLDTPGGLKGYDLLRVVMLADVVLMPVCYSMFDRESAAECLAELQAHPRVVRGRCKIAAVGMRVDSRTKGEESLRQWADKLKLPFLGALRETQTYVKCLEHGLTIFDMPPAKVETDLAQWQTILQWLQPVLKPVPADLPTVARQTRPVLAPGSHPAGHLRKPVVVEAAPASTMAAAGHVEPASIEAAMTAPSAAPAGPAQRPQPATADEDLDSRFGFSTRIGRWLEMLSMRRAR
jgi:chromosome partitioning protein